MDYKDALILKNTLKPFSKNYKDFIWMVVPLKGKDLNLYTSDYYTTDKILLDEDAKNYSTDDTYDVWHFPRK